MMTITITATRHFKGMMNTTKIGMMIVYNIHRIEASFAYPKRGRGNAVHLHTRFNDGISLLPRVYGGVNSNGNWNGDTNLMITLITVITVVMTIITIWESTRYFGWNANWNEWRLLATCYTNRRNWIIQLAIGSWSIRWPISVWCQLN